MNLILALPLPVRLASLFVLGACAASFLNLAIDRFALSPRQRSPWSRRGGPHASTWLECVPIFGWLPSRRLASQLGRGFWVRPLLIELGTAALFAWLYWWEVDRERLLNLKFVAQWMPHGVWPAPGGREVALHLVYQSHLILISLMIVATFIDIDDQIIPDEITVLGTLAGLVLAAAAPWSLLPAREITLGPEVPAPLFVIDFLKLTSPGEWMPKLDPPNLSPLFVGLGCFWGWCVALMPRHWRPRRGLAMAARIFFARLRVEPFTWLMAGLGIVGSLLIWLVWWIGGPYWAGLLTSLVGLAVSGGIVWFVRVAGAFGLGREAMGFGDVTLMAMIGSFLGWQSGLLVFFLSPFAALVVGVIHWIVARDQRIPYGPFLCLSALALVIKWASLWTWAEGMLRGLGMLFLLLIGCVFLLLLPCLIVARKIRELLGGERA